MIKMGGRAKVILIFGVLLLIGFSFPATLNAFIPPINQNFLCNPGFETNNCWTSNGPVGLTGDANTGLRAVTLGPNSNIGQNLQNPLPPGSACVIAHLKTPIIIDIIDSIDSNLGPNSIGPTVEFNLGGVSSGDFGPAPVSHYEQREVDVQIPQIVTFASFGNPTSSFEVFLDDVAIISGPCPTATTTTASTTTTTTITSTTTTSTTTTESTTTTTSTSTTTTTLPCTDPEIEVSADKPQYRTSDRMNIGLKITNQRCSAVVDILIIVERPLCVNDNRFVILEDRKSVTLPSGFDFNNPTWKSLFLPPIHWGDYTLRAFIKDPATGKTISQSEATFSFGNS
jgi:hypothetical protein